MSEKLLHITGIKTAAIEAIVSVSPPTIIIFSIIVLKLSAFILEAAYIANGTLSTTYPEQPNFSASSSIEELALRLNSINLSLILLSGILAIMISNKLFFYC